MSSFEPFAKIPRLFRNCIITEKIDGTNAQVIISEDGQVEAGSRTRIITPGKTTDNYGFAEWVQDNREDLLSLGPGRHFGEWWGNGIQRGYGLPKGVRLFSLFNVTRWGEGQPRPACCQVVPVLYKGLFSTGDVAGVIAYLRIHGSRAAPFMNPEGIIVFHEASGGMFKVTCEHDQSPKSVAEQNLALAA